MRKWFGKYRGTVAGNMDPLGQGRLMVKVPGVFGGGEMNWAMPCVPFAGPGLGMLFLPPEGANVWVEFEEGNSQLPIWSGCFWGTGQAVALNPLPVHKVLKTESFELSILEVPGAPNAALVEIRHAGGHRITMDPTSVTITNGVAEIRLSGPSVTVNRDGLEVT